MYVWWPFLHWHWIFIEPYSDTFTDAKWIIIQIQWNWWKFCQGLLVRTKCENLQTWISLSSRTPHFLIAQLNTLPLIYFFFSKTFFDRRFPFCKSGDFHFVNWHEVPEMRHLELLGYFWQYWHSLFIHIIWQQPEKSNNGRNRIWIPAEV